MTQVLSLVVLCLFPLVFLLRPALALAVLPYRFWGGLGFEQTAPPASLVRNLFFRAWFGCRELLHGSVLVLGMGTLTLLLLIAVCTLWWGEESVHTFFLGSPACRVALAQTWQSEACYVERVPGPWELQ